MEENSQKKGIDTMFKDKAGNPIGAHSYVKDGNGRLYFINSHMQAVPDWEDAPAVELKQLAESSEITLMSATDVMEHRKAMQERPRRGGRRARKTPAEPEKRVENEEAKHVPTEAAPAREELFPATMQLVISAIPDNVLADELRRRGYTLCAVKPALLTL